MRAVWVFVLIAGCGSGNREPVAVGSGSSVVIGAAPAVPLPPPFDLPAPADKVVSIGRFYDKTCVVRASGALDCWGRLSTRDPADPSIHRVAGVTDAVAISKASGCVLRRGGKVSCLDSHFVLVPKPKLGDVRSLGDQACFVVGSGDVQCVDGDGDVLAAPIHDAVAVTGFSPLTCALRKDGTVACSAVPGSNNWRTVAGLDRVTQLVVDEMAGCAIEAGELYCFELVDDGHALTFKASLPIEIPTNLGPEPIEGLEKATDLVLWFDNPYHRDTRRLQVIIGGRVLALSSDALPIWTPLLADAVQQIRGCAIRTSGAVACWGSAIGGALARPSTIGAVGLSAAPVVGLRDIVDLAVTGDPGNGQDNARGYALAADGEIFAWGHSDGLAVPRTLGGVPAGSKIVQIAVDRLGRVCARADDGHVWCQLGENRHPGTHLGFAPLSVSGARAIAVPPFSEIVEVTTADGRLQRVALDTGNPAPAVPVPHTCKVASGHVSCARWLSHDDPASRQPVQDVPGITDAVAIGVSEDGGCALGALGEVSCWRFERDSDKLAAAATRIERGAASIASGPDADEFGCALMRDRTVQCWGSNLVGEHGDGALIGTTSPIGIPLD